MVAFFMLFTWPLVVVVLFFRTKPAVALICSIVAGYLLLPVIVNINLPLLPPIGKDFIPSATAAIMAFFIVQKQSRPSVAAQRGLVDDSAKIMMLPGFIPRHFLARTLLVLLIFGAFMTSQYNSDNLVYEFRTLPRLGTYDAFSVSMNALVALIPLFLGRKFLSHPDSHRTLLVVLCIAGLLYSLPALYEVRMSPQLNKLFYGFFPSDWRQTRRGSGFRPVVFLQHGLLLALFLSGTLLAALAYFRATPGKSRWFILFVAPWMFVTLALAKSFGALLTVLLLAPAILFLGVRLQLISAAVIAMMVLTYPVLRSADLIPVDKLSAYIQTVNPARAQSFQTRLTNEDQLLDKAMQRPLFGWGRWGRARVFDERGRDISVTDGHWIITIGEGGWTRYISELGLLTFPIVLLALRRRRYDIGLATSGLSIVLAANLMDLIPNSGLTPITWLMTGALLGRLEMKKIDDIELDNNGEPMARPGLQFSRAGPTSSPGQVAAKSGKLSYTRQLKTTPGNSGAKP